MADLTLYHAAPSRSSVVRWMLEELGQPYDVHLLKLANGDQAKPDYLAINPMGKVPALKHGDAVVTEVAAICTYLADEFPHARLNIPVGDPRRGAYLKWLFFSPSCIGGHRPGLSPQGRAAPGRARLWRFRHGDECGGEGGRAGALPHGRAHSSPRSERARRIGRPRCVPHARACGASCSRGSGVQPS